MYITTISLYIIYNNYKSIYNIIIIYNNKENIYLLSFLYIIIK